MCMLSLSFIINKTRTLLFTYALLVCLHGFARENPFVWELRIDWLRNPGSVGNRVVWHGRVLGWSYGHDNYDRSRIPRYTCGEVTGPAWATTCQ